MNTKFNTIRRVILIISVQLTATWLPLTNFAQDVSKTGDLTQGTNTRVENCAHCRIKHQSHEIRDCHHAHDALTFLPGSGNWMGEETVGFTETDPAVQKAEDVVAVPQASNHLSQQISAGFSETNPASNLLLESLTALSATNDTAQQGSVGFSETDPATSLHRSIGELRSQHVFDCLCENAKDAVLIKSKYSNLTGKGNQHEIS
jgi:hypothetical protein